MVLMPGPLLATSGILVLLKLVVSGLAVAVSGTVASRVVPASGLVVVVLLWYKSCAEGELELILPAYSVFYQAVVPSTQEKGAGYSSRLFPFISRSLTSDLLHRLHSVLTDGFSAQE